MPRMDLCKDAAYALANCCGGKLLHLLFLGAFISCGLAIAITIAYGNIEHDYATDYATMNEQIDNVLGEREIVEDQIWEVLDRNNYDPEWRVKYDGLQENSEALADQIEDLKELRDTKYSTARQDWYFAMAISWFITAILSAMAFFGCCVTRRPEYVRAVRAREWRSLRVDQILGPATDTAAPLLPSTATPPAAIPANVDPKPVVPITSNASRAPESSVPSVAVSNAGRRRLGETLPEDMSLLPFALILLPFTLGYLAYRMIRAYKAKKPSAELEAPPRASDVMLGYTAP